MKIHISIKTTKALSTVKWLSRELDVPEDYFGYPYPAWEIVEESPEKGKGYPTVLYSTASRKGEWYIAPRLTQAGRSKSLSVVFEGFRGSFYAGTAAFTIREIIGKAGASPADIRVVSLESSTPDQPVVVEWEYYKNFLSISHEGVEIEEIPEEPILPDERYSSKPADQVIRRRRRRKAV